MTLIIHMPPRNRVHWVQLGHTWCGRMIYASENTHEYTHDQVREAFADGKWCKICADAWWMAVGSKGEEKEDEQG